MIATTCRDRRLVVANGCFDLIHPGHVALLEHARCGGDPSGYYLEVTFVLVALNSDDSVRRLKGPDRPYLSFQDRARMLLALRHVDAVVGFDEDTPEMLLEAVRPDLLVKGQEYAGTQPPGYQYCGGVSLAPMRSTLHTTGLVEEIRRRPPGGRRGQ